MQPHLSALDPDVGELSAKIQDLDDASLAAEQLLKQIGSNS